jgi:hypothetical protein
MSKLQILQTKQILGLFIRKRNIPIERQPLPEKYCRLLWVEGVACSAQRIPTAISSVFQTEAAIISFK